MIYKKNNTGLTMKKLLLSIFALTFVCGFTAFADTKGDSPRLMNSPPQGRSTHNPVKKAVNTAPTQTPPPTHAVDSPVAPTPTHAVNSPVAPTPTHAVDSPVAPTPTHAVDSPVDPAPTHAVGSPVAPSPTHAVDSPVAPTPTHAVDSPVDPAPTHAVNSPVDPAPTHAVDKAVAPVSTPVPAPSRAVKRKNAHQRYIDNIIAKNTPSTIDTSSKYYIQVGAFGRISNALKVLRSLKRDSLQAKIVPMTLKSGTVLYRVRIYNLMEKADADMIVENIHGKGFPTAKVFLNPKH